MPPRVAFFLCLLFTGWLFYALRERGSKVSFSSWVPLLWILILASRPVSVWLGSGMVTESTSDDLEGSPMDRMFFLLLIVCGLRILSMRRLNWRMVIDSNRWLFVFFLYLAVSSLWSDYPFVSFKRWVKDFGNIVMALVVLSEPQPVQAIKRLLLGCSFVIIPFSVLVIKYFPDLGRYYNRWTYQVTYCGVGTDKNMLGAALVVCGIGLVWSFLDLQQEPATPKARQRKLMAVHVLLIAMGVWLLIKANSSTSLICIVFSTAILLLMRLATLRTKVARHLGAWTFLFLFVIVPLNALFNIGELFVGSMGRDLTFTGRTEIWQRCLASDINPFLGVGYYSFWNGPRAEKVSEGFFYQLNEAHSGFIETYLNSGIVGLFLLGAVLLMTGKKIRTKLEQGGSYQALRLGFLVVVIFYNITEAAFNRLTAIWFVALLLLLEYPLSRRQPARAQAQPAGESAATPGPDPVFPGPPPAGSVASV